VRVLEANLSTASLGVSSTPSTGARVSADNRNIINIEDWPNAHSSMAHGKIAN